MSGYIDFKNVKKKYKMGEVEIEALSGVDFRGNGYCIRRTSYC